MIDTQPTGIQIHLTTGVKRMFYLENRAMVDLICEGLDGQIFARPCLLIETANDVIAFPGYAIIGITVITDALPEVFSKREQASQTVVTQISPETYRLRRQHLMSKVEGRRSSTLSQIDLDTGERLFLEYNEVAVSGMDERIAIKHLFTHGSLTCRRLEGGFSIWNAAHFVSWSHFPKLEVPIDTWKADLLPDPPTSDARFARLP